MAYQFIKRAQNVPVSGKERDIAPPNDTTLLHASTVDEGQSDPGIDAAMKQRMERFARNQIPEAEQEADRIAADVEGARTPEDVKLALGEQLGANFSDVRFHVNGAAEAAAESIGARAYTQGRDVYFGEGGFDPAIAAHELVHTAQQGMVDSAVPTTPAPAGGIQMVPKFLKKIGSAIAKPFKAIGRLFSGGGGGQATQPHVQPGLDNFQRIAQTNVPSRAGEQGSTTFSPEQIATMRTGGGLRGDSSADASMAPTMTPIKDEFHDFFDQLDQSGFDYASAQEGMEERRFGSLANVKFNQQTVLATTKLLGMLGPHLDTPQMQAMLQTIRENEMANTSDPSATPEERFIKGFMSKGMMPVAAVSKSEAVKANPNRQKISFLQKVLSNSAYLERMFTSQDAEDFPEDLRPLMEAYAPIRGKFFGQGVPQTGPNTVAPDTVAPDTVVPDTVAPDTAGTSTMPQTSAAPDEFNPAAPTEEERLATLQNMIARARMNGDRNLVDYYTKMLPRSQA